MPGADSQQDTAVAEALRLSQRIGDTHRPTPAATGPQSKRCPAPAPDHIVKPMGDADDNTIRVTGDSGWRRHAPCGPSV
ncbi:hypothetical protein GCM10010346_61010 [Streptomyces chryseus]|uniref:Uncharacterized protein n=1 Tax=Streptomyces chryseus TaxID=68186 RepID=A0ABQ3EB77_9ACTN|nr:hypothetical protein GCM10010346_61010 [Streptomyces chryseus]